MAPHRKPEQDTAVDPQLNASLIEPAVQRPTDSLTEPDNSISVWEATDARAVREAAEHQAVRADLKDEAPTS